MYLFWREALRMRRDVLHDCVAKSSSRTSSAAMIGRLQSGRCATTELTAWLTSVTTPCAPPPPPPPLAASGAIPETSSAGESRPSGSGALNSAAGVAAPATPSTPICGSTEPPPSARLLPGCAKAPSGPTTGSGESPGPAAGWFCPPPVGRAPELPAGAGDERTPLASGARGAVTVVLVRGLAPDNPPSVPDTASPTWVVVLPPGMFDVRRPECVTRLGHGPVGF